MQLADEIRIYRALDNLQAGRDFRELRAMNGARAGHTQNAILRGYHNRVEPVRPPRGGRKVRR